MAKFSPNLDAQLGHAILENIVRAIAEEYVRTHFADIAAKLDQQAIASLAIAESGKKIAEEIRSRPVVLHDTKAEVYERGIFGSTRRVR